jgi:DNA-binding response OmpR family regulator
MKVLLIEDNVPMQKLWKKLLREKPVEVISAYTIDEAREEFKANPDVNLIVVAGCIPGVILNTEPLVRDLRAAFTGPMIATSGCPVFQSQLVAAGCNHKCDKGQVPKLVCQLLGL